MQPEDLVQFPLYGLECHECGNPASWWSAGVTLPCYCGLTHDPRTKAVVVADVRWAKAHPKHKPLRAQQIIANLQQAEARRIGEAPKDEAQLAIEGLLEYLSRVVA